MRRLWVFVLMFPTAAFAEVCDKERPLWTGTPTTAWSEAIILLTYPSQIVLLTATMFAMWYGWRIACFIFALIWVAFIPIMLTRDLDDMTWEASQEGCISSPILFMGLCGAISVLSFYAAFRRRKTKKDTTCSKD
ncbi:hypothetical protein [uncultured Sulfitobacter sp.]|uniref:hypothetical protein n=1 Tax=uncultured Sulfitobacter sp. TaxID=191468 RepID=UPI0026355E66|nr:hypothetical protein [uncultured Sulfitobacter sp.]